MIETERLYLEPIKEEHYKVINAEIKNSHAELSRWLFWVNPLPSEEETRSFCKTCYMNFIQRNSLQLAIFSKVKREFIGCIGIHNFSYKNEENSFDIGYWIGSEFSGKGYMTEALNALCKYSFKNLGAERIYITNDTKNIPSNKLAKKTGFILKETIENHMKNPDGISRNTNIYCKNI